MKNLNKTNELVALIDSTFDLISYIYEKNDYCFLSTNELIENLSQVYTELLAFSFEDVNSEIWNASSKKYKLEDIKELVKIKFFRLINSELIAIPIPIFKDEIRKHLDYFLVKQALLNRIYTPTESSQISRKYSSICHQLLKFFTSIQKMISSFERKIKYDELNPDYALDNLNGKSKLLE